MNHEESLDTSSHTNQRVLQEPQRFVGRVLDTRHQLVSNLTVISCVEVCEF